jgi:hypothetical protein
VLQTLAHVRPALVRCVAVETVVVNGRRISCR